METEVKLGFKDKESLADLAKSEFFQSLCKEPGLKSPVLFKNSYMDTDDLTVTHRGGMIRIRYNDLYKNYEFTVKYGGGTESGLHRRHEWNLIDDTGVFGIEAFRESQKDYEYEPVELLDEVFAGLKDEDLKIICSNDFSRTYYEIRFGDSDIEACFDCGIIRNSDNSKTDEICELELELLNGSEADLNDLADIIKGNKVCGPLDKTKYGRTLEMVLGITGNEK